MKIQITHIPEPLLIPGHGSGMEVIRVPILSVRIVIIVHVILITCWDLKTYVYKLVVSLYEHQSIFGFRYSNCIINKIMIINMITVMMMIIMIIVMIMMVVMIMMMINMMMIIVIIK